jgi:predicted GIY-YIG superfamily endonuclease
MRYGNKYKNVNYINVMRWVYILQCEYGYFYVGETSRLYRRFWEHQNGLGGLNTYKYPPINIVAIYSVNRLGKFFEYNKKVSNNDYRLNYNIYFDRGGIIENFNIDNDTEVGYDNLWVENNITEKMMLDNELNWKKIRGGKYVRFDVEYNYPNNQFIQELPNCDCGFPCDVKKNDNNDYLYFRCAKKNMWDEMREEFEINEPCNFFMKYTKDNKYKIEYEKRKQKIKYLMTNSYWLNKLVDEYYEHCIGGCGKEYDGNNTVRYLRKAINLCFDCFINKNEELSKKYNMVGECLIQL